MSSKPQQTTTSDTIHARIRRARRAIGIVTHDGKVTTNRTSYDYVSHQRLLAAVDPALDAEGLWHSQSIEPADGCLVVRTTIYSDDGESLTMTYVAPRPVEAFSREGAPRNDLQSWGAAQSYGRRLGLMAALGLRDGSDEQASRYEATVHPRADAGPTTTDRDDRVAALAATGLTGNDLLRALHDATRSGKLKAYLRAGRDPLDLPPDGWEALMPAIEAICSTGIDGDLPL